MMKFVTTRVSIPRWVIFLVILILIIGGLIIWLYQADEDNAKLIAILAGLVSGLIVYVFTFVSIVGELKQVEFYRSLGIRDLLSNRHDKEYYKKIVGNAKTRVDVMGASCVRFVEDFLDLDSDDKALVDALVKHPRLRVRFLIPKAAHMSEVTKKKVSAATPKFQALQRKFKDQVQFRRFDSEAAHSFVLVDDELIAGPVFAQERSKHDPAVHVEASTPFGRKYVDHFQMVWDNCETNL